MNTVKTQVVAGTTKINLVSIVYDHIVVLYSKEAANKFAADKMIKDIAAAEEPMQRMIINRYIVRILLVYRSLKNVDVSGIITMATAEGVTEDWLTILRMVVIPFLSKQDVINTVS